MLVLTLELGFMFIDLLSIFSPLYEKSATLKYTLKKEIRKFRRKANSRSTTNPHIQQIKTLDSLLVCKKKSLLAVGRFLIRPIKTFLLKWDVFSEK